MTALAVLGAVARRMAFSRDELEMLWIDAELHTADVMDEASRRDLADRGPIGDAVSVVALPLAVSPSAPRPDPEMATARVADYEIREEHALSVPDMFGVFRPWSLR